MKKINRLYAYVAEDEGMEGIIGAHTADGVFMPFVGADVERSDSLRETAQKIGRMHGKKIKLIKLSKRTEEEVIFDPHPLH